MTREVQSFPQILISETRPWCSNKVGKIVQLVRLFHSGQFHGLLVEGSKNDGVNLPGLPCFDSFAQAAQDIQPRFGTDFPQRMVCARTRVVKELRMSIDHRRNFDSALVQAAISNNQTPRLEPESPEEPAVSLRAPSQCR